jgi:CheY-like chemotaxis protein
VVDDEASIREVARETLVTFGYTVMTAQDGTDAIAQFAARASEIQLVLTDMMMPFMDGPATIRALRKLAPSLRIIATSGLKTTPRQAETTSLEIQAFLPKPYTAETLLKTIAMVLKNPPDGSG